MGRCHVEIAGEIFNDKQQQNGDWVFPGAGRALKGIDPSGGKWRVVMDHIFDPADNEHNATGNVEHDGEEYFAEVIYVGESRTIYAGAQKVPVTFVHDSGSHSILPIIFRR